MFNIYLYIFYKFSELIPLSDFINCKIIPEWNTVPNQYYFEINCKQRQVYRVKSLSACEKWVETINAAIIYSIYWNKIIKKTPKISEYYYSLKEETTTITNIIEERKDENIDVKDNDSFAQKEGSSFSRNSKTKKPRRPNPFPSSSKINYYN